MYRDLKVLTKEYEDMKKEYDHMGELLAEKKFDLDCEYQHHFY